jgi:hypothetical protein
MTLGNRREDFLPSSPPAPPGGPASGVIFGEPFTTSGFRLTATVPLVSYRIAAFAWSAIAGTFSDGGIARHVTVR